MLLTKSNLILKQKPKDREIGKVKNSITNVITINSIDDLEKVVLNNPFNTAEAKGISSKDWISQQLFALDFDGTISIPDFIRRAEKNSLIPNLVYTTLSDTAEVRKFRAVFCLERKITDEKRAKWILLALLQLFPEADEACKDLCRMYYPGKEIIYKKEELNHNDFFESILHSYLGKDVRFYEKFNKLQISNIKIEPIKRYNWDIAIKEIKLLDLFFNNNVRLSYHVLFSLMSNAQYIYGGVDKILNRMKEINNNGGGIYFPYTPDRGIEKYEPSYFNWNHLSKYNYTPATLENFSPFTEDHEYHNLLELKLKKGEVEIIEKQNQISIADAEIIMKRAFEKAKANEPFKIEYDKIDMITGEATPVIVGLDPIFNQLPENPIYIFKITTGLGKTQTFLNETNALIALPRHKLKDEVSNRMLVPHKITPETPHFSNDSINLLISQYRDAGLYEKVSTIIRKIQSGKVTIHKEDYPVDSNDMVMANLWIVANDDCRKDDTTVLTTHKRAVNDASFKHDFIIFDEDPFSEFVDLGNITLDFAVFDGSPYKDFINSLETFLRNMPTDCIVDMNKFERPNGFNEYAALKNKGHIIKLIQSSWIYKSSKDTSVVHFCKKIDLPKDKKIFIMSASAAIPVYQKLYGDRVIVVDISNIKSKGIIEQYTRRSYSVSGMGQYNQSILDNVFNNLNGSKVITHMKHSLKKDIKKHQLLDNPTLTTNEYLGTPHGLYFGNLSGSDKLNGYDVTIIGTPHKPSYVYYFIMKMINLSNVADTDITNQIIEWNGFRFWFMTFEDKDVRDIQLSLIESELLQAAGRSRFLRNNNKTKIYSNLPLKITTKFYNK